MGRQRCQLNKMTVGIDQGMFQILDDFIHGIVTSLGTLLRALVDDLLQGIGKILGILGRRIHLILQMLDGDRHRAVTVKRDTAGHHLIHGDAQRVNIGFGIGKAAAHLLRRTVVDRTHGVGADRIG